MKKVHHRRCWRCGLLNYEESDNTFTFSSDNESKSLKLILSPPCIIWNKQKGHLSSIALICENKFNFVFYAAIATADLVLVLGTSLSGLTADQVIDGCRDDDDDDACDDQVIDG